MACNLCAPGYFGDAIHLKDCQSKYFMDIAVVCVSFFRHCLNTLVMIVTELYFGDAVHLKDCQSKYFMDNNE
jgi:hypothetical protein